MIIIDSYFQNARLSLAAYAILDPTLNSRPTDYIDALKQAGMAEEDARRFSTEYTIIDQSPPNAYSFSATLFEREGRKYLAIRGTNDVIDLFIDFGVFVGTGAIDQYRALEAYYADLIARGKLSTADQLVVTGHSLGGFLAQGFAVDHPDVVTQVFTYNAPGLGGIVAEIFEALGITPSTVPLSAISNLRAEPGLSATASLGTVLGSIQPVLIEAKLDPIHNHSIITLTDSLALYDLFARIDPLLNTPDPAVGIGRITDILKAVSSEPALSLEAALDSLRLLFKDPAASILASTATDNREQFYQNLLEPGFEQRIASYAGQLSFSNLTNILANDLANLAQGSSALAFRYALKKLNPFAVVGNNELYAPHNPNGELDLYDPATGQGTLTAAYLADRAAMLAWKDLDYTADSQKVLTSNRTETYQFIDKTLKDAFGNDLTLTVRGSQLGSVGNPAKVIFGNDADETLVGSNLAAGDHLYGGGGADTLQGNQGNDYLEGGSGNDTYVWNTGDGFDTILDTDGVGRLVVNGKVVSGGIKLAQGDYVNADNTTLHFEGDPIAGWVLIVNGDLRIENFTNSDFGITLGMPGTLADIQPTEFVFVKSLDPFRFRGEFATDADDLVTLSDSFAVGGLILFGSPSFLALGGDDLMIAPDGNTFFVPEAYGGSGDDVISTNHLVDEVGGVYGGYVEGEGGSDAILGSLGNDYLYGDTPLGSLIFESSGSIGADYFSFRRTFATFDNVGVPGLFYNGSDHIAQYIDGELTGDYFGSLIHFPGGIPESFDWLGLTSPASDPEANDDYVSAGAGNDLVTGGAGNDELYGGDGDDFILGGHGNTGAGGGDVNISLEISGAGPDNIEFIHQLLAQTGDDYLDGGNGNDSLRDRDGGSDVLLGGAGDDILFDDDRVDSFQQPIPRNVAADNFLDGGDGNDLITVTNRSSGGFDVVIGGEGDDTIQYFYGSAYLDGGLGSDSYEPFHVVSQYSPSVPLPSLTIHDFSTVAGEMDTLHLPANLLDSSTGFSITRDESNLYFGVGDDSSWITIENWFVGPEYKIEEIVFDTFFTPGLEIYDVAGIESQFITTTAGADFLWGSSADEQLAGGLGDDTLFGDAGNDTLAGGEGNDSLDGGEGADVYAFNIGDGVDRILDTGGFDTDGISFGAGITPDMLTLGLGSLLINIGSSGDAIHLDGFDPNDALNSNNIEYFQFADGTTLTYQQLLDRGFDFAGMDADDVLSGTSVSDRISGLEGNDILDGGAGDDVLMGGLGNDTYFFGTGSGSDLIEDAAGDSDSVSLGAGIDPDAVTVTRSGGFISLRINSTSDELRIHQEAGTDFQIEQVQFADGTVWDAATLETMAGAGGNTAPTVASPIADQSAPEDAAFSFTLPADTFFDADAGDTLAYAAARADGTLLPAWLSFDAATQTFSGTPENDDVGAFEVTVTATDSAGESVSDLFDFAVININDAPVLINPILKQWIADGDALRFQLSADTFNDIDAGDTLSYTAALADGTLLPAWLAFDAVTRTFSGMPDEADIGTLSLSVTATDASGATASDSFDLNVTVAPDKTLMGTGDDDLLAGRSGNDTLDGLAGDDALFGRSGNDRLSGGLGDDLLVGGKGDDTYVYRPEDGLDMVADEAGSDAVAFGTGLTRDNVVTRMSEDDSTARVRVLDSYGNEQADQGLDIALGVDSQSPIEWFTFADGDSASLDDLLIRKEVHTGTRRNDVMRTGRNDDTIYADRGNDVVYAGSGHDMLFGDRGRDVLYGEAGNDALVGGRGKDKLYGGSGDDMLEGGRGSDLLDGGAGFNTYMFERGFGDDRIVSSGGSGALRFGAGITARDLSFKRRDNDLVVKVNGDGRIRIEDWFDPKAAHPVERAEFADGTVLNADKFVAKGYDYERERNEDDDDDEGEGAHDARDDDGTRPRGAPNNQDHDGVRSTQTQSSHGKSGEIPDGAWFEKVVEKWNAHSGRPDAQNDDAHGDTQRHAQYTNRWQRMHDQLNAHLAADADDGNDGGADLASLKPGFARGLAFTQFRPIGYGGVGVEDRGAADLRLFTGLKEGLARIA